MIAMRLHWDGISALYAERDRQTTEDGQKAVTIRIAEQLNKTATGMEADIPTYKAALPAHRAALVDYFVTLACDTDKAGEALDIYMATYEAYPSVVTGVAGLLREFARIEMDILSNGPTEQAYDRYDTASYRYDRLFETLSEQWSQRARILKDLADAS